MQAELDEFERLHDEARLRDATSAHLFVGRALLTAFGWESPTQAITRLMRSIEPSQLEPGKLSKQLKEAEQSAALLERAAVRAAAAQEDWDLVGPERFEVIGALVDAVANAEPNEQIASVVQTIAEGTSDVESQNRRLNSSGPRPPS